MRAVATDASSKGVKAAYFPGNNPVAFIDSIVARKGNADENFSNIRIAGDGGSAAGPDPRRPTRQRRPS